MHANSHTSRTCTSNLKHQANNLQFKGLTGIKGHILSLSSPRRSSLTPLKRGRRSWWGVLRVKPRPCVTRTILPVWVCVCVCVLYVHWLHPCVGTRGRTLASSTQVLHTSWTIPLCHRRVCLPSCYQTLWSSVVDYVMFRILDCAAAIKHLNQ